MSPTLPRPDPLPRIAAVLFAACTFSGVAQAGEGLRAGLELRTEASAADIGLPIYPGAVVERDRGDDKAAVTLGLWGGALDFKLVVLKFTSTDSLAAVAGYYRDVLSRSGHFVDCSLPRPASAGARDPAAPPCDDESPAAGPRLLYKAGTAQRQRMVELRQVGPVVHFQLIRLDHGRQK